MQTPHIDQVIVQLETIISDAIQSRSREGYFAALYHKVTCKVRDGILAGDFEDGARMELFDVLFANRYLDARTHWKNKQEVSTSWKMAFEMTEKSGIIILQHLLLGINAHINLDLGIAVVELARQRNHSLDVLRKDFNAINTILAALSYEVINELNQMSPLLSLAGLHANNNSMFIQFALSNARDGAWCFAEDLYTKSGTGYPALIKQRDLGIATLGTGIAQTKGLMKFTMFFMYLFEWKNPARIIQVLHQYKKSYFKISRKSFLKKHTV